MGCNLVHLEDMWDPILGQDVPLEKFQNVGSGDLFQGLRLNVLSYLIHYHDQKVKLHWFQRNELRMFIPHREKGQGNVNIHNSN